VWFGHGWATKGRVPIADLFRKTAGMHPAERMKCLLDPTRLAVAGTLASGDIERMTVDHLTVRTGLDRRNVLDALGVLTAAGLVDNSTAGFQLDVAALREIARELAEVELPMDPFIGFGMTGDERKVLSRFFHGRTLNEIPSNRAKRLIVLERLALEFDVGRRYPESDVNAILGRFHPDWSSLRRHLVDEGLLDRERNEYWRAGGKVV
jgi:DNA-binding transcriptional ArsR family regulator